MADSISRALRPFAALSLACIGLLGCSGFSGAAFPDAAVNPAQVPIGTIQGSVYGGHAPLVGSHVYVLTPSQTGYGSQATSLLSASYQSNGGGTTYATHLNTSDPNIPTTWYYETTDSTGAYNISGDYTCTAGDPIYLYAYGGSPTFPSANNVFTIDTVNVESRGGSTGAYTYTIQFHVNQGSSNPTENFYAGEPITLSGFTGSYSFLNTATAYVASNTLLTTTAFEVSTTIANAQANPAVTETFTSTSATELASGSQTAPGTATVTPGFNPAVVNLALLGVCPSTGSLSAGGTLFNGTTSNPIQYVYMNEVSTVAAAYALEGFTPTSPTSTTNATYIGTSASNLIGLQNAFLNAAQLYDINGSQITTSYAGEGHIANPKTPAGNGSVPQNLLNTLGNILAACVDSNNTSTVDKNANESAQCKTLFETATSNGVPEGGTGTAGVIPVDTAQAMINIAHHPGGDTSNSTTFMTDLYALPTGNVPFTPNLVSTSAGRPSDFTVAIQFPYVFSANTRITSATSVTSNAAAKDPDSVAIDGYGNVWVNTLSTPYEILELNPLGVLNYTSAASSYELGYLTIDPNNNIFSGSNAAAGEEIEIVASGTANLATTRTTYTYTGAYGTTSPWNADGFYNGYMSVADGNGNIFIAANSPATNSGNAATSQDYTIALNPSTPGTFASLFTPYSTGTSLGSFGAHGAVENASINGSGDIWWSNAEYSGTSTDVYAINRVKATTGQPETGFPILDTSNSDIALPEAPAIDQNGNFWAIGRYSAVLLEVTQAGVVTTYNATGTSNPAGLSIDGDNNIFVAANFMGSAMYEFSIAKGAAISTGIGYDLGGQLSDPVNVAMDLSGNLWIATDGNSIVEWIGAGAPLYTPLSKASKNNAVSTRP